MDWDDLRFLLAAVRGGSLARAAEELDTSASTVSRRLAALEESLGTSLLVRTPDGLRVTAAGQVLVDAASRMDDAAQRIDTDLLSLAGEVSGRVRLATPLEVGRRLIAPLLPQLLERHPKLELELVSSTRVMDLARWEADLAIRSVRPRTEGELVFTKLREEPWTLFGRPELVPEAITLATLESLPWISWSEELSQIPAARWLSTTLPEVRPRVTANEMAVIEAAVAAGVGVGLLPRAFGRRIPTVVEIPLPSEHPAPYDPLFLVAHGAVRSAPKVAAVWTFLVEHFRPRADRDDDGEFARLHARTFGV
jgi:DNA-binding transcriptional LysR family regulator